MFTTFFGSSLPRDITNSIKLKIPYSSDFIFHIEAQGKELYNPFESEQQTNEYRKKKYPQKIQTNQVKEPKDDMIT